MKITDIESALLRIRSFVDERDWEQFHSPKNLSMALSGEVAEVVEIFQWLTEEDSYRLNPDKKQAVSEELADVFFYLIRMSDKLDVDLFKSLSDKMDLNEKKYPADLVRGKSKKYNEYS